MHVASLAFRTDLAILERSGSMIEHGPTYAVVRTPDNPGYRWGNFLLLDRPPSAAELRGLEELFLERLPGIRHRAYGVDAPAGTLSDLEPLKEAGYDTELAVTLVATHVSAPPRPSPTAEVRRLETDDDWEQRVALDLVCHDDGNEPRREVEAFTRRKAVSELALTTTGHGAWYGAFEDGRLLASMGIVRAGDRVARLQEVQTHPEARGRGLAGTLVHAAGADAFQRLGAATLVTVADPDYHAIRIYRSVGFTDAEVQLTAELSGSTSG